MKNNPYEHIATPDQIPNSFSDEALENEAMRTTSLKEFAKQTKDLTARLSVQLRRNAELEAQVKKLAGRIITLKEQNEEISNNSLKNRQLAQFHEEELEKLNEQLKKTEIELGQMTLLHRNLLVTHEQGLTKTDTKLRRFERYHARINKFVRPKLNQLFDQNLSLLQKVADMQRQSSIHKDQFLNTKNILDREKKKQKSKLNQAADLQDEIISTYETELKLLQGLVDQRDVELKNSEDRRRYLEGIRDKYVVMENKAIAAERMRFEIEKKYDDKVSELRTSIIEIKDEYKSEKQEFETQRVLLEKFREENEELSKKYFDSATIATSARGQSQANFIQLEQMKASKNSLEKQVLELQSQIRAQKEENRSLRTKLDEANYNPKLPETPPKGIDWMEDSEDIKEEDFQILSEPKIQINSKSSSETISKEMKLADLDFTEMGEIDRLIKEIETGYPIKPQLEK